MPAGPRLFSYRSAQKPNIFLPVGRKKDIGESVVQPKWLLSEAVLSETVLVLDGCSNFGDADPGSKRSAVTCGPMAQIAILNCFEFECEYSPLRRTQ